MKSNDEDEIKVLTCNLEHDGGPDVRPGTPPRKWFDAHEMLASKKPDILFRQEMTYSEQNDYSRLKSAMRLLSGEARDVHGWVTPSGKGKNPTGLFLNVSKFTFLERHEHTAIWRTLPTNVSAHLAEVPERPIVLVSWHGAFNSPNTREAEGDEVSALVDKVKQGMGFMGGCDGNEYPVPAGETVPPVDWANPEITDKVHRHHRARRQPDGTWQSCTYVDQTLLGCGMHDPARYAAHVRHQTSSDPLAPTAGHAATGQGGGRRIDRIYLDGWLVQAVLGVEVIDTTGISDHHAVMVTLARRKAAELLRDRPELPGHFADPTTYQGAA